MGFYEIRSLSASCICVADSDINNEFCNDTVASVGSYTHEKQREVVPCCFVGSIH